MGHNWPGNVRELYHTLECAWLVGGGQITTELLANDLCAADEADYSPSPSDAMWLDPGRIADSGGFKAAMDSRKDNCWWTLFPPAAVTRRLPPTPWA